MLRVLCSLVLAVALAIAPAPAADAQTMRQPRTGEPALVLDVPPGFTAKYDAAENLQFFGANQRYNLQLAMAVSAQLTNLSLANIAANVLQAAGVPAYTRSAPATIAGRKAEAFFAQKTYPNGAVVDFAIILARLDDTYVATVARVTSGAVTPDEEAQLDAAIGQIRIVGAP